LLLIKIRSQLYHIYIYKGVESIEDELSPNFWRTHTDNDAGNKLKERCVTWKNVGENKQINSFTIKEVRNTIVIGM